MNDPQPEGHMASHIGRRKFLATLGGAVAWPLAVRAQQPGKIPRIGIIDDSLHWNAFRHGLRDLGYLEGQNIAFDYAYPRRHSFVGRWTSLRPTPRPQASWPSKPPPRFPSS